jgi:hypothetical protein
VKKSKITARRAATIQCRVPQRAAGQFQAPPPPAFTVELTELSDAHEVFRRMSKRYIFVCCFQMQYGYLLKGNVA